MTAPIGNGPTPFASTLARAEVTRPDPAPIGEGAPRAEAPAGPDFGERVEQLLDSVNAQQVRAEQAATDYADGTRNDLHGTMIALEQADITFRFVSNVRSRLVEAYREVMRMGA